MSNCCYPFPSLVWDVALLPVLLCVMSSGYCYRTLLLLLGSVQCTIQFFTGFIQCSQARAIKVSLQLGMRSVFGKKYREHGSTKCGGKVLCRAISREWVSISLDTSTHECILSTFECASSALTRGMTVRKLRELRYGTSQLLSP